MQGVKAAKGQPDFLAGKDNLYTLHSVLSSLSLVPWSKAAAEKGAKPLCLAAGP